MKKTNITLFALIVIAALLLSACSLTYVPDESNALETLSDRSEIMFDEPSTESTVDKDRGLIKYADEDVDESDVSLTLNVVEGELVDLQPKAIDPDDDLIKYGFTGPFNEVGLWQTQDGDAGKYLITITATDGDLIIKEYILINVHERNKGPVVECPEIITVMETETINLNCNVYDVEGDVFALSYSGFMTTEIYQTAYGDAGEYTVLVTAEDNESNTAYKEVKIIIKDKNRLPIIDDVEDINAVEYDIILVEPTVSDDDGDELTITFAPPFDEDGVWVTEDGDAGSYSSYVKVSDGVDTVTEKFNIYIEHINTRPYLAPIPEFVVDETDLIIIDVNATDAEEDALTITFTGWMTSDTYQTTYDDAGVHYTKVTVSDGRLETSQNVKIIVNNVNRPPVIVVPG